MIIFQISKSFATKYYIKILIKEMEGMELGKICYNLQELEQRAIVLV